MSDLLQDKVCLITGASRGLGAQIAELFWQNGASLLLVARSKKLLEQRIELLGRRNAQMIFPIEADLSDPSSAEHIIGTAHAYVPQLHIVVNNAAIQGPVGVVWSNDWSEWTTALQVDFISPARLCSLAIPWLSQVEGTKIINISGGGAVTPRPRFSAYASAKSALVRFSETISAETGGLGIDVNCVAAGAMNTQMLEEIVKSGPELAGQKEYDQALSTINTGGTIHRAASLCLFLASAQSDGISGKLISAVWDPWESLSEHRNELMESDVYTQRRIVPADRGFSWSKAQTK
jgi:3-oxoacyl-[acyl-carrier protein] reductase